MSDAPDFGPSPLRDFYPAWWRYYTIIAAYTQQTTTKRPALCASCGNMCMWSLAEGERWCDGCGKRLDDGWRV